MLDQPADIALHQKDTVAETRIPLFTYPATAMELEDRAREVTAYLGGDPNTVASRPEFRNSYAFFDIVLPDGPWFLKLMRTPGLASRWRERDNALFAASQGWGPQAIAPERYPDALLTRLIPGRPMTWYEVSEPGAWPLLLQSIKSVHDSLQTQPPPPDFDITEGPQARLNQLRDKGRPELVSLDALQTRLDQVREEQRTHEISHVYCHRDFHMGNVIAEGERLWIIDWEYADWSDPWLEVARFAALAHMSSAQAPAFVQAYTGRTPEPWQVRYVRLCMAAINIEFFTHNYRLNGCTPMTLRYLQAIHDDGDSLRE